MSPSSRESELTQLREALAQTNSELFFAIADRRKLCLKIQTIKEREGQNYYDPERERVVFEHFQGELKSMSLKELLSFSLLMEDQASALAPGSYPAWSARVHLAETKQELYEMMNPLMLKVTHPEIFKRLKLSQQYSFLTDF